MAITLSQFENAVFELADILRTANFALQEIKPQTSAECQKLLKRIAENRFNVVVAGRFNRGKSTLLNAILGADYLPTGGIPITSVITAVKFGNRARATLEYDGFRIPQEIALTALRDYVTEEGNPGNQKKIKIAQLEVPSEILRHDYFFVDTPGLASAILENTRTTEGFLPEIDALILVTSFESPFSEDEVRFLEKAVGLGIRRIFLAINKSDLASDSEQVQALKFVRQKCMQLGFGDLPIWPVSARTGLEAKKQGDIDALKRSGILDIEAHLISFLTHDKSQEFLVRLIERVLFLLGSDMSNSKVGRLLARTNDIAQRVLATGFEMPPTRALTPATALSTQDAPPAPHRCRVCAEALKKVLDYFSGFQLYVSVDEATRTSHAQSRGLCSFHTWQYESLASPLGTASGYFPLLLSLSKSLSQLARSSSPKAELVQHLMASLATHSRCPGCRVRALAEKDSIDKIKSESARTAPLCLPHLTRLVTELDDRPLINDLLIRQAAILRRIAEELQRYALRRDALRSDLITEEEQLSPQLALQFLTGNKHVDALWFVDAVRE